MKGYRTKSNREAGTGRCDLFVKPVSRRKEAFIVEFKKTKKSRSWKQKHRRHCSRLMTENLPWSLRTTVMTFTAVTEFHFAVGTAA